MRTLNWCGRFESFEGYTHFNLELLENFQANNSDIKIKPIHLFQFNEWTNNLFAMADYDLNETMILVHPPDLRYVGKYSGRIWCLTMYESTRVPDGWVENLNKYCERLLVPSDFCAKVFISNGVKIPVHVIGGGTNPEKFKLINYRPPRPYTFMCLADRGTRKGVSQTWSAFYDVFKDSKDVRLVVKCRPHNYNFVKEAESKPSNICIWREDVIDQAQIYEQADCFVFPTAGEGFGMPPREAAIRGLPVICTNFSGTENCENWALPLRFKMKPAQISGGGQWASPNLDDLKTHMKWCFEHQEEAKQFGIKSSLWLQKNENWDIVSLKLRGLLNLYAEF